MRRFHDASHAAVSLCVLLGIALLACTDADDRAAGDPFSGSIAAADLPAATTVVHVAPGGEYRLNNDPAPVAAERLGEQLRARKGAAGQPVLEILAEPGVVGYDVVLVVNAARSAGYSRVQGVAEYQPGSANDKQWSQELHPQSTAAASDTPRTLQH